jgi:uncharacterized protein with HEPN domain
MPLDVRKYLFDIQEACRLLELFTAGKAFTDYSSDPLLRSGVERQFEIIGEALNQMLKLGKELAGRISDCQRIIALRNRLIHGYAIVSNQIVWDIIETKLPILAKEIAALVSERIEPKVSKGEKVRRRQKKGIRQRKKRK